MGWVRVCQGGVRGASGGEQALVCVWRSPAKEEPRTSGLEARERARHGRLPEETRGARASPSPHATERVSLATVARSRKKPPGASSGCVTAAVPQPPQIKEGDGVCGPARKSASVGDYPGVGS